MPEMFACQSTTLSLYSRGCEVTIWKAPARVVGRGRGGGSARAGTAAHKSGATRNHFISTSYRSHKGRYECPPLWGQVVKLLAPVVGVGVLLDEMQPRLTLPGNVPQVE